MRSCWIVYDRMDLDANRFFADRLRTRAEELGMEARIVVNGSLPDGKPDLLINRGRDWKLSAGYEMIGTLVSNPAEACRIGNDKLETYLMARRLGIPHMQFSRPGETLPPGPPWVVKSRIGHGGSEVFLAGSRDEVGRLCSSMGDRLPLVQAMADPGADMRVYVLGGRILAAALRTSGTDFRANRSLGGRAEICAVPEDVRRMVEDVCADIRPDLAGIDFVFSDGRAYLNEVEDAVGTRMLYELTDLDPAGALVEHLHSKMSL
ncbi:MAG: ATP-grasp domain-containing protein [Thermoplasmata archaeon]|nr:ATP-grasp domain-containing protein [Thermoplasmata archaeon]